MNTKTIEQLRERLKEIAPMTKPYPYTVLDPCYSRSGASRWDRDRQPWVIEERNLERKIKELEVEGEA